MEKNKWVVYIGKCQYEIQELKEVLVWYTGTYWHISNIDHESFPDSFVLIIFLNCVWHMHISMIFHVMTEVTLPVTLSLLGCCDYGSVTFQWLPCIFGCTTGILL
jgi:hypothetical protein